MYKSGINYERTAAERADQFLAWNRSDDAFFAAGACHILAFTFYNLYPNRELTLVLLQPHQQFKGQGTHVYAVDGEWAFDFNGWSKEADLLAATREAYGKKYPGWDFDRVDIKDDLETFCHKNNHRAPAYFAYLPWERTYAYIKQFDERPPQS